MDKEVTINDIAREAGVSKATVSRVLNNPEKVAKNQRKVLKVIQEKNYRPNLWLVASLLGKQE